MKTPTKILIVAALAVAVVAALTLKKGKSPVESEPASPPAAEAASATAEKLPKLLELGSVNCIPCKMMAPIIEELKKEYAGRMNVEFIDVWKDESAGKKYGVEVIPTQIFFDAGGKELFRHVGFISKEDILGKWKELGVKVAVTSP